MAKKPIPQLQSELLQARVTPDLLAAVTRAAIRRNLTTADFVRSVLSEAIHGPHLSPSKRPGKAARKGERA